MEKAEREMEAEAKLAAKNSPAPVADGPATSGKKDSKVTTLASLLMKGSILNYDVYQQDDTIPMRGGEVELRADAAIVSGPPSPKKLTASRKR